MDAAPALRFPPDLGPPYDGALREAVATIVERFAPVGVVAAGSILRGEAGPTPPDPEKDA